MCCYGEFDEYAKLVSLLHAMVSMVKSPRNFIEHNNYCYMYS